MVPPMFEFSLQFFVFPAQYSTEENPEPPGFVDSTSISRGLGLSLSGRTLVLSMWRPSV